MSSTPPTRSTPLGQMLIASVEDGGRLWEIKNLIDDGAPLDETDSKGDTALIKAAAKNDFELVEILLNAGCDPNIPDRDGNTPLIRTIEFVKDKNAAFKIVYALLERDADTLKTNNQGYDLMHYAEKWKDSNEEMYTFLRGYMIGVVSTMAEENKPEPVKKTDNTRHKNLRNYLKRGMKK